MPPLPLAPPCLALGEGDLAVGHRVDLRRVIAGFPQDLEVTAETGDIVMGLRHKSLPIHGVQFHPESIASEHGHAILKNFLDLAGAS